MARLDELNSTVDSFMTSQMEYNNTLMNHDHPDPILMFLGAMSSGNPMAINNGRVVLSIEALQAGVKAMATLQVAKHDGIMGKLKGAITEMNTSMPFGSKEPGSKGVSVS